MQCELPASSPSICSAPKPKATLAKSTNENTITINLPTSTLSPAVENNSSQLRIEPQPFKLSIETSTDWPIVLATILVGVGSILTTLLVGWLSHVNQRTQIRSATASFRHGWQTELRQTTARFLSIVARLHFEIESNPDYLNSSESNKDYGDLIETQARIELMLDQKKQYTLEIIAHLEKIIAMLKDRNVAGLTEQCNKLTSRVNLVLEQTWDDIRKDLGAKVAS